MGARERNENEKSAYEGIVLAADGLGGAAVVAEDVGAVDANGDTEVADLNIEVAEVLLHLLGLGLQKGARGLSAGCLSMDAVAAD